MSGSFTVTSTGQPSPTYSETGALPTGDPAGAADVRRKDGLRSYFERWHELWIGGGGEALSVQAIEADRSYERDVLLSTGQPRWPSIPGLYAGTPYEVVPPAQSAPPAELNGVASPHISLAGQLAAH